MRMDRSEGVLAADWMKQIKEDELVKILQRFGEEKFARRIARNIKRALLHEEYRDHGRTQ